ncbi:MAG: VWA domain-containing protein [Bacteroidales bacterium]|jgi:Ca-activated chloride channel family protein|nr:VWA domain-containing protein [Bacteroidales bacterium]
MNFVHPAYFYLLLILIPIIVWYILKRRKSQASMQLSTTRAFDYAKPTWKVRLRHLPFVLRILVIMLLIMALARPQSSNSWQKTSTEGIDIMLVMDISTSMLARDLTPNRVEAAKAVAASFVSSRPNDNIGLVIFAGESFTQCPMTIDHTVLLNLLKDVRCGMISDGTAIGLGLATAVTRLKDSQAKSKIIILLTDGSNNVGDIAPVTAAEIAESFGIRVYTVGAGTIGEAEVPVQMAYGTDYIRMPVDIDETTLRKIAATTGGEYFRATNTSTLKNIYAEIDKLEKTKINTQEFSKKYEEYLPLSLLALVLLLLEIVLRKTVLREFP